MFFPKVHKLCILKHCLALFYNRSLPCPAERPCPVAGTWEWYSAWQKRLRRPGWDYRPGLGRPPWCFTGFLQSHELVKESVLQLGMETHASGAAIGSLAQVTSWCYCRLGFGGLREGRGKAPSPPKQCIGLMDTIKETDIRSPAISWCQVLSRHIMRWTVFPPSTLPRRTMPDFGLWDPELRNHLCSSGHLTLAYLWSHICATFCPALCLLAMAAIEIQGTGWAQLLWDKQEAKPAIKPLPHPHPTDREPGKSDHVGHTLHALKLLEKCWSFVQSQTQMTNMKKEEEYKFSFWSFRAILSKTAVPTAGI